MRLLIVDPSEPLRARIREIFEEARAGMDIREAARLGPELADVAGIDALLLEVRQPEGLEVLARARARLPDALLVVLTNEANEYHRRECLARGADHFFDKSREFERAVRVVLEHRVLEHRL